MSHKSTSLVIFCTYQLFVSDSYYLRHKYFISVITVYYGHILRHAYSCGRQKGGYNRTVINSSQQGKLQLVIL